MGEDLIPPFVAEHYVTTEEAKQADSLLANWWISDAAIARTIGRSPDWVSKYRRRVARRGQ
jgi:hypothetical protein